MNKQIFINLIILFSIILGFFACDQEKKSNSQSVESHDMLDTIIVKHKRDLNKHYAGGLHSKEYFYYWLVGKDTLDFAVSATEYKSDSTLRLRVFHRKPILFSTTLTKINDCFNLIKEDFYLSKLNSFYFKEPIYYLDLAKELSTEYEKQFGRKNISQEKQMQFLLNTKLNNQLNSLVNPLNKEIKWISIEKFRLLDKKYYADYLPNVDLTEYPEFTIDGMGLSVQLVNKKAIIKE